MHDVNLGLWNGEELLRAMTDHHIDICRVEDGRGRRPYDPD
jgi:hypothetical protein